MQPDARAAALARFEAHQRAWRQNEALRSLYTQWYGRVRAALPDRALGPWIELGSGPGFAREMIPGLELSDVVRAPWHDHEASAEALPWADGAVGALVLFDVLHHLGAPARFFAEATRVLAPGGRIVLCEPYVSPLSYPAYKLFHEERLDTAVDPLGQGAATGDDPFDGNQAIPTVLFQRRRAELEARYPALRVRTLEHLAGPSYVASGGFSRKPLLPLPAWRALRALEDRLPAWAFRLIGFRMFVVMERLVARHGRGGNA